MGGEVDQIGFGNNRFVAFGNYFTGSSDYSCSAVSDTMPTRWSKQKSDFSGHIRVPIIFCNGYFYHYTWNSQLVRSLDGINWTQLTKPSGFDVEHYSFNVLYYKGIYYILDSHRLYSTTDFNTYKRYRMPFESISFWNRQSMVILDDQIVIARENKLYYSKITELVEDN